ncbi:MAG: prepilin-type N-terminal cleavage/methylation domain-containing protein [Candidatus Sumerlaeia bacterium]|nr:prepilin-type N-terminal cleavage/methylation domain-containing protein [Candidatus Sumerlaeia bacterium]
MRRGLTLIELLVVVAVIAILAALAIPNFLEAQTRAKVAAARSNLRVVTSGLEAYAVDQGQYPPTRARFPADPFALYSDVQLARLTTPVAYITGGAFRDPFGTIQARPLTPSGLSATATSAASGDSFPELQPPNSQRSLLYYHYPSLAARHGIPRLYRHGGAIISIGPDLTDSLGAYRPFDAQLFQNEFGHTSYRHPIDTEYDPTNGTISLGDLGGYAGDARRFEAP